MQRRRTYQQCHDDEAPEEQLREADAPPSQPGGGGGGLLPTKLARALLSAGVGPARGLASPGPARPPAPRPASPAPAPPPSSLLEPVSLGAAHLSPSSHNPFEDDATWQAYSNQAASFSFVAPPAELPAAESPARPATAAPLPPLDAAAIARPRSATAIRVALSDPPANDWDAEATAGATAGAAGSVPAVINVPPAAAARPNKSHKLQAILTRARATVAARGPGGGGGGGAGYSCMGSTSGGAPEPEAAESSSSSQHPAILPPALPPAAEARQFDALAAGTGTSTAPHGAAATNATQPPVAASLAATGLAGDGLSALSSSSQSTRAAASTAGEPPSGSSGGAATGGAPGESASGTAAAASSATTKAHAQLREFLRTASLTSRHCCELLGLLSESLLPPGAPYGAGVVDDGITRVPTFYRQKDVRELVALMLVQRLRNVQHQQPRAAVGGARDSRTAVGHARGRSAGSAAASIGGGSSSSRRSSITAPSRRGSLHGRSVSGSARLPPLPPAAAAATGAPSLEGASLSRYSSASFAPSPTCNMTSADAAPLERTAAAILPTAAVMAAPVPTGSQSDPAAASAASHVADGSIERSASLRSVQSRASSRASSERSAPVSARPPPDAAVVGGASVQLPPGPLPTPEPIHAMRFSPNGQFLAVAGGTDAGGVVRVWRVWSWDKHVAREEEEAQRRGGEAGGPLVSAAAVHHSGGGSAGTAAAAAAAHRDDGAGAGSTPPLATAACEPGCGPDGGSVSGRTSGTAASSASSGDFPHLPSLASSVSAASQPARKASTASSDAAPIPSKPQQQPAAAAAADATPTAPPPRHASRAFPFFEARPLREWAGHSSYIVDVSWSASSSLLLSASMDCSVRLWSLARGSCLHRFVHSDIVTAVAFSPLSDSRFVTGCFDQKLRLWSADTGRVVSSTSTAAVVTAVAFAPDAQTVAAGLLDGTVALHTISAESQLQYLTLVEARPSSGRRPGRKVTSIEFAQLPAPPPHAALAGRALGGTRVMLVATNDSRLRLIRLDDYSLAARYVGHSSSAMQVRASFDGSGQRIVSGSEDGRVCVWRTLGDQRTPALNQRFTGAARHRIASVEWCAPADAERRLRRARAPAVRVPCGGTPAARLLGALCGALLACAGRGRRQASASPHGPAAAAGSTAPSSATAGAGDGADSVMGAATATSRSGGFDGQHHSDDGRATPCDDASDSHSVRSVESGWGGSDAGGGCDDSANTSALESPALGPAALVAGSGCSAPATAIPALRIVDLPPLGSGTFMPATTPTVAASVARSATGAASPAHEASAPPALRPTPTPSGGSPVDADADSRGAAAPVPGFSAVEIPEEEGDDDDDGGSEGGDAGGAGDGARRARSNAAQPPRAISSAAAAAATAASAAATAAGGHPTDAPPPPHPPQQQGAFALLPAPPASAGSLDERSACGGTGAGKEVDVTIPSHRQQPPLPPTLLPAAAPGAAGPAAATSLGFDPATDAALERAELRARLAAGGRRRLGGRVAAAAVPVALFAPEAALAIARPLHAMRVWAAWPRGPLGGAGEEAAGGDEAGGGAAAAALLRQQLLQSRVAANRMVLVAADAEGVLRVLETACPAQVV